ncbi:MAG: sensor hybrid histidine kinase, partial [Bacteroidetes bacterium]|nr:sensor hybrid histidine kinase [Bacteroidota bacterium]
MATTRKNLQTRKGRKGGRKPGIGNAHRRGSSVPRSTGGRSRNAGTFIARNSWFHLVYESMTDAFVRVDMKGRLKDFNKPFVHMVGYEARELRKMTYTDLTPEQWHEAESGIITHQVLTRGYSELYEKEYRRKD